MPVFLMDSGASNHIIGDKHAFSELRKLPKPVNLSLASGDKPCTHEGTVYVKIPQHHGACNILKLDGCLFLPGADENLVSLSQLANHGYQAVIHGSVMKLKRKGFTELSVHKERNVYPLYGNYMHTINRKK